MDLYVFLRVIWPMFAPTTGDDRAYLGRQMATRAREAREADEAEAAAKARIESRRRGSTDQIDWSSYRKG